MSSTSFRESFDKIMNRVTVFDANIATYATKYGIDPAELLQISAAAGAVVSSIQLSLRADEFSQAVTKWRNDLLYGVGPTEVPAKLPALPILPTIDPNVVAALTFLDRMAARIKGHTAYSKGDGEILGIEKPAAAPIDWNTAKAQIVSAEAYTDEVIVEWRKGKAEGVAVYGSYDAQNFSLLGRDNKSPYNDTRKNQSPNPEFRYYKVRFLVNDKEVGQFSDVVKVLADVQ